MKRNVPLVRLRNIGIAAHIDAGKTTVTEQILVRTGRTHRAGTVHEGTAQMDYTAEERRRGITITSAATTCGWRVNGEDHQINIIDTPGHVDFTMEVERSLRVLDGAVAVFCAVGGVEPQSETVWRQADRYDVPRLAFVNKLDRAGADPQAVMAQMRERLGCEPLALQLPLGLEGEHRGVIDLLGRRALAWGEDGQVTQVPVPDARLGEVEAARQRLVERIIESDERLVERYLGGEEISAGELHVALRRLTLSGEVVPVLLGAALRGTGIELLLDAVARYLPSPLDAGEVRSVDGEQRRAPAEDAPLCALVFKLMLDPYVGQLTFARVYSGRLERGDRVLDATTGERQRVSRILRMHANRREELEAAGAGEIVALVGVKNAGTGDTLCAEDAPMLLESIERPEPVVWLSVEPATKADQAKLGETLHRLAMEDPSFRVRADEETGQTLLGGMGELHLEVLVNRLAEEFGVEAQTGRPRVAYRETILTEVTRRHRLRQQNGGQGVFAEVEIALAPGERGSGLIFREALRGASIPREFVPGVEAGVREAAASGPLSGHELVDLEVTLLDGAFHEKDSSDMAFRKCAAIALREAVEAASPALLEPIMEVEVTTPEDYLGQVMGDLSARRGQITGSRSRGHARVVAAKVPLATMFGYASALRSATQGRASYTMSLGEYALAPRDKS